MSDMNKICTNCEHSMEIENDPDLFCTLHEQLMDFESCCEDFE